jgi:hypothetical protein
MYVTCHCQNGKCNDPEEEAMTTPVQNLYRIGLSDMLKQQGRTFEEMANAVMFGDENAIALCTEQCEVEPDGTCPHGCPSFLRAAGII